MQPYFGLILFASRIGVAEYVEGKFTANYRLTIQQNFTLQNAVNKLRQVVVWYKNIIINRVSQGIVGRKLESPFTAMKAGRTCCIKTRLPNRLTQLYISDCNSPPVDIIYCYEGEQPIFKEMIAVDIPKDKFFPKKKSLKEG